MKSMDSRWTCVVVALTIVLMSTCARLAEWVPGIVNDREPDPEAALANTEWMLDSYGEPGAENPVLEETEVTLRFGEEGHAGGFTGCNTFGAQYVVADGTLSFSEIIATEIACPGVMEQEREYLRALRTAGEFELTDNRLRIWYDEGERVLNFVKAAQG